jgi:hypothetical protein
LGQRYREFPCGISIYICVIPPIGLSPLIIYILPHSHSYGDFSQDMPPFNESKCSLYHFNWAQ